MPNVVHDIQRFLSFRGPQVTGPPKFGFFFFYDPMGKRLVGLPKFGSPEPQACTALYHVIWNASENKTGPES